jgi:hypothetical protein
MILDPQSQAQAETPFDGGLTVLLARLEAVNLRGLSEAASVWLGEDPDRVGQVLASFRLGSYGELPQVTARCWTALAPLGLSLPPGPASRILDELLIGVHTETQVALDALAECRQRAECVLPPLALPAGGTQLTVELWRRALVAAVVEFWSLVTGLYRRTRVVLLRGDYAEVCQVIGSERQALGEVIERIEVLSHRVVGVGLAPVVHEDPRRGPSDAGLEEDPVEPPGRAPAVAPRRASRRPVAPADAALRSASGGFGEWAPIAFLIISTWLAIGVLLLVMSH